jgi:hypothetical protein
MKFSLVIGEGEKHFVEYESDSFSGSFQIKVDHKEVKNCRRFFIKPLKETCDLDIGQQERLNLKMEMSRGMFSGEKTSVYVNGRLARCYTGNQMESKSAVCLTEKAS